MKIAIIPARGGSTRVPGKNKRVFRGKPIICYAIEAAYRSALFDRVIVTTDDPDIAKIAMDNNAWALYRPEKYCADDVGTQEVLTQYAGLFDAEFICGIYATTPLLHNHDICRAFRVLNENPDLHYAMAVGTEPLRDAGQFYFGRAMAFIDRKPLLTAHTAMIPIEEKRVCDINTEEDWARAEVMFDYLYPPHENTR